MRILKSLPFTILISLLLVSVTVFCISGTVLGKEKNITEESCYRELEQLYVEEVRSFLAKEGYKNSGVAMTKIIEENGTRNYTVTIHHKGINSLSETEQTLLKKECGSIAFPMEGCGLSHKFLP